MQKNTDIELSSLAQGVSGVLSDHEILVSVESVSKKFCRSLKKSLWYGIQDIASELAGQQHRQELRHEEFWAVKNVSFELKRGECLGLVGPNGSGKSTLLKMLNGLIKPDCGRIEMRGKVCALIELGTGFIPVLTGRENIYNNAAVLGFTKVEVDQKFDDIVEFAEIGDFINMPLQNYSSGMKVRLGFAIAAQLEPDVLIIDEVLAVGDIGFRNKCYSVIDKLVSNAAVILVTHNMESMIRIANRGLVLNRGNIVFDGLPVSASANYSKAFTQDSEILEKEGFKFKGLIINDNKHETIKYSEDCRFSIKINALTACENLLFSIVITTTSGQIAAEFSSRNNNHRVDLIKGDNLLTVVLADICLLPQKYYVSFTLIQNRVDHIMWCKNVADLIVEGCQHGHQPYQLKSRQIKNDETALF